MTNRPTAPHVRITRLARGVVIRVVHYACPGAAQFGHLVHVPTGTTQGTKGPNNDREVPSQEG